MAIFIIENKLYDTEKMEYIGTVQKWFELPGWLAIRLFCPGAKRIYNCELYKSAKGNFLLVHRDALGTIGEAISENEAKELLLRSNYTKYAELYGPLKDA